MTLGRIEPVEQSAARHQDPGGGEHGLGPLLVHGQGRGKYAGVGVGDVEGLQHALHAAVLAPLAMQGVERHIRLQLAKHCRHVAPSVHPADLGP